MVKFVQDFLWFYLAGAILATVPDLKTVVSLGKRGH